MHDDRLEDNVKDASRRRERPDAAYVTYLAPLLLALMFGLIERARIRDAQETLKEATHEAVRQTDFEPSLSHASEPSTNARLVSEVKRQLVGSKIDADRVQMRIVEADDPNVNFDLDDPQNAMRFFQIRLELPCSEVLRSPVRPSDEYCLTVALTFRNSRPRLTQ